MTRNPDGVLSWRFQHELAGYGTLGDLMTRTTFRWSHLICLSTSFRGETAGSVPSFWRRPKETSMRWFPGGDAHTGRHAVTFSLTRDIPDDDPIQATRRPWLRRARPTESGQGFRRRSRRAGRTRTRSAFVPVLPGSAGLWARSARINWVRSDPLDSYILPKSIPHIAIILIRLESAVRSVKSPGATRLGRDDSVSPGGNLS
jgi:hypothetical protein